MPKQVDPLATNGCRGDPILTLHGRVDLPLGHDDAASAGDMSAGVLFLERQLDDAGGRILVSVVKADLAGTFPTDFTVELLDTPPAYAPDGWDAGLFAPNDAPDAVSVGYLMVGRTAAIEALPSEVEGGFADALAPLLADVTVTAIQVLYAEGVEETDVLYPSVDEQGDAYADTGYAIAEGFTLVDASRFFVGGAWAACYEDVLGDAYDTPAYAECVLDNAERIECGDGCSFEEYEGYLACLDACDQASPGQIDRNGCLASVAAPTVAELCGEQPIDATYPDISILDPSESLSLTLGDDDGKGGLALQFFPI